MYSLFIMFIHYTVAAAVSPISTISSSFSPSSSHVHEMGTTFTPINFHIGVMAAMTANPSMIPWDRNNPNNPNVTIDSGLGLQILNCFIFALNEVNSNPKYNKWFKVTYDVYDDQCKKDQHSFIHLQIDNTVSNRDISSPAAILHTLPETHICVIDDL
jgi:hypothetical protein